MARQMSDRVVSFSLPFAAGLFLGALALILGAGEDRVLVRKTLVVSPLAEAPVISSYMSSQAGLLETAAVMGEAPEKGMEAAGNLAGRIRAVAQGPVVTVEFDLSRSEAETGKTEAAAVKAAKRYLQRRGAKTNAPQEAPVAGREEKVKQVAGEVAAIRSELAVLLANLPGEFDSRYLPTGQAMKEAEQIEARMAYLQSRVEAIRVTEKVPEGADRQVPGGMVEERLMLLEEKKALGEKLGPLHPRMVRLVSRISELDDEIARRPGIREERATTEALDKAEAENIRKEMEGLKERLAGAWKRADAVHAEAKRISGMVVELAVKEAELAGLNPAPQVSALRVEYSLEEIGASSETVHDTTGTTWAGVLAMTGLVTGLVFAVRNGKGRLRGAVWNEAVPPMLADLRGGA
ncbi:MAG: hypothetical protein JW909_12880 [Planctomycetes bacterium]|nr:hypothetical protein [Planctomycetota bacterium]